MYTCICMAEFLHCSPETTTTLLIGYTPKQNKKLKVWGKKKSHLSHGGTHLRFLFVFKDLQNQKHTNKQKTFKNLTVCRSARFEFGPISHPPNLNPKLSPAQQGTLLEAQTTYLKPLSSYKATTQPTNTLPINLPNQRVPLTTK